MRSQNAVEFRTKPLDRSSRLPVQKVRAKFYRDTAKVLESVAHKEQLCFGIECGSLHSLGIPGRPDLDSPVCCINVHVRRHPDRLAVSPIEDSER